MFSFVSVEARSRGTRKPGMCTNTNLRFGFIVAVFLVLAAVESLRASTADVAKIENAQLAVEVDQRSGAYTIRSKENPRVAIKAGVAAQLNHRWFSSGSYPRHTVRESSLTDHL